MVNTFDLAMMVIEEKSEELAGTHTLNNTNLEYFKGYCEVIDKLVTETEAVSTSVDIAADTNDVYVIIELDEVFIQNVQTKYLALIESAKHLSFNRNADDYIEMTFTFPSLWDKV